MDRGWSMRFVMLDRITSWEAGKEATAIKNVALSEDFFDDHFPTKPIMPGALILEGMAQLAGLLLEEAARLEHGLKVKALMSIVERAKFRSPVFPGDQLTYHARVASLNEAGGRTTVTATCDGQARAEATLVFTFHELVSERLERRQQEVVTLWMRDLER